MPILGSLLVSLFGSFATHLLKYFSTKLTLGLAFVATLTTITAALFVMMRTLIGSVVYVLGDGNLLVGLSIALPPTATACFTAIVTCWTSCTLYSWKRQALLLFAKN